MQTNNQNQRSMLVFGEDWGGLPSSTQHLISQLISHHDYHIDWVNSIGLRRPKITARDAKRLVRKVVAMFPSNRVKPIKHQTDNSGPSNLIYPKTLPAPQSRPIRKLAAHLLSKQISNQTSIDTETLIWTSLPTAIDTILALPSKGVIYYAGDDFAALTGVDHQTVIAREKLLLEKADLVIAASVAIYHLLVQRCGCNKKIRLLPHGVNCKEFMTPASRALDLPNDGQPIAGFYGSISSWLDQALLSEVMARLPNWHFVFIGNIETDITRLRRLPNFIWLGSKPHNQLACYSQHWTASLLPFIDNQQIRACNPLKLQEYILVGKPIISTPFPALQPYKTGVTQVRSPDQMVLALKAAQDSSTHISLALRSLQRQVEKQSWQEKAITLQHWLGDL
ncbi:glycosyltransferase family 1 protein [Aliivibrio kagoshimensis]|uniref:glycosyltransferase family 1 protein n=1 Tax=Aliivibrio kagoshimensis TaxID=2910230 RepID=UPI003D140F1F